MMSDGSLSQAEIDALLQSGSEVRTGGTGRTNTENIRHSTARLQDLMHGVVPKITEIAQNEINMKCTVKLINSEIVDVSSLRDELSTPLVQIARMLSGPITDRVIYLLTEKDAVKFAVHAIGQDDLKIDDLVLNALQEAFSQISEPLLQKLGEQYEEAIDAESTTIQQVLFDDVNMDSTPVAINTYQISIAEDIILFYEIFNAELAAPPSIAPTPSVNMDIPDTHADLTPHAPVVPPSAPQDPVSTMHSVSREMPSVKPVALTDFGAYSSDAHQGNLELLMDVDMQLTVELGKTRRQVREILQLGEGSIIELDKLAGEPVDVMVNHQLIAKGEVVVIDENFGVRITEIVSSAERIANLG